MKKGLVLEGGAMRGMFTSGVLDVFLENGLVFDGAIGVSAGATFGCNYKSRQIGRAIRYNKKYSKNWRYCSFRSLIFTGDLYGADFCYNKIPNELDYYDLESYRKNPMKFFVVASDCKTGKAVYKEIPLCDKNELESMRASASMPLASRVVKVDGYQLLDGGITDSIPLEKFESMGYEKNVVILTQEKEYRKEKNSLMPLIRLFLKKYPLLVKAMEERHLMYNREKDFVFEEEKKGKCLVICPDESLGISRTEKNPDELERVYQEGRKKGEEVLEKVKEFLEG